MSNISLATLLDSWSIDKPGEKETMVFGFVCIGWNKRYCTNNTRLSFHFIKYRTVSLVSFQRVLLLHVLFFHLSLSLKCSKFLFMNIYELILIRYMYYWGQLLRTINWILPNMKLGIRLRVWLKKNWPIEAFCPTM